MRRLEGLFFDLDEEVEGFRIIKKVVVIVVRVRHARSGDLQKKGQRCVSSITWRVYG